MYNIFNALNKSNYWILQHIFNVGNDNCIDINEWVEICYDIVGNELKTVYVDGSHEQIKQL